MKTKPFLKICALVLALITCLSSFGTLILADTSGSGETLAVSEDSTYVKWDGTADTTWFNTALTGSGTTYSIDTPAKLAGLAKLIDDDAPTEETHYFAGDTFQITANFDLSGYTWNSIGTSDSIGDENDPIGCFAGNLIGAKGGTVGEMVSIKGLNVASVSGDKQGVGFISIMGNGSLKNITLVNPTVTSSVKYTAFFAGRTCASANTFENLHVIGGTMNIKAKVAGIGSIVGRAEGSDTYTSCSSDATFTLPQGAAYVGGMIGNVVGTASLTNCVYTGKMTFPAATAVYNTVSGGMMGAVYNGGSATLEGCYFGGFMEGQFGAKRMGGFVGWVISSTVTLTNCQMDGIVSGGSTQNGAIIGRWDASASVTLINTVLTGAATNSLAGVNSFSWIGHVYGNGGTLTVTNCYSAPAIPFATWGDAGTERTLTVVQDGVSETVTADVGTAYSKFMPTPLTGTVSLDSTVWTTDEGGMPILRIAKELDRPYAGADLTWFTPTTETSFTLNSTSQLLGLARLSHLYGFTTKDFSFTLIENKMDYTLADPLFAEKFFEFANVTRKLNVNGTLINSAVLDLGVQTRLTESGVDLRLLSTIDKAEEALTDYYRVGFELTRNDTNQKATLITNCVYQSVTGYSGGIAIRYIPKDTFDTTSTYFYAVQIDNIPTEVSLSVRAFIQPTADANSRVYGRYYTGAISTDGSTTIDTPTEELAANYQIVYPENDENARGAALKLRDRLKTETGIRVPVIMDSKVTESSKTLKTIYIGNTSLTTAEDNLTLGKYQLSLSNDGYDFILLAGTPTEYYNTWEQLVGEFLLKLRDAGSVGMLRTKLPNKPVASDESLKRVMGTMSVEEYLSSFQPVWADETWSYDENYVGKYDNFYEKTYAMTKVRTRVTIKSHRGDLANYPDNSLEGIVSAILAGVDVVEFDVHLTKDKVPVIIHDATLSDTTNYYEFAGRIIDGISYPASSAVDDWTYEQLQALSMTKGGEVTDYKMTSLYEALALCAGRVFVHVDDKTGLLTGGSTTSILSEEIYHLAKATESRECFYTEYSQDKSGEYRFYNWASRDDVKSSTDWADQHFVAYVDWCYNRITTLPHNFYWPHAQADPANPDARIYNHRTLNGSTKLDENATTWNEMVTLLGSENENSYWFRSMVTENPYALRSWLEDEAEGGGSTYNEPVSYTLPSELNHLVNNKPTPSTPENVPTLEMTIEASGTGDTYDWEEIFS